MNMLFRFVLLNLFLRYNTTLTNDRCERFFKAVKVEVN